MFGAAPLRNAATNVLSAGRAARGLGLVLVLVLGLVLGLALVLGLG